METKTSKDALAIVAVASSLAFVTLVGLNIGLMLGQKEADGKIAMLERKISGMTGEIEQIKKKLDNLSARTSIAEQNIQDLRKWGDGASDRHNDLVNEYFDHIRNCHGGK